MLDREPTPDAQAPESEPEYDPLREDDDPKRPRRRYALDDDTDFDEVPKRFRRFYRRWDGAGDTLAPNEVLCPVCNVVIRSKRELRVGDRVYCMACMVRMRVVRAEDGTLQGKPEYD